MRKLLYFPLVVLTLQAVVSAQSVSTLNANNTAGCVAGSSTSASPCTTSYAGQDDIRSNPGPFTARFNATPQNVSKVDIHTLAYRGTGATIFGLIMPPFCLSPVFSVANSQGVSVSRCGGSSTGGGNVLTQYISDDVITAAKQVQDMVSRGFNGITVAWYAGGTRQDNATKKLLAQLPGTPLTLQIMYDGGTLGFPVAGTGVPGTGGNACPTGDAAATAQDCILRRLKNDLCYLNGNYFGSAQYFKLNTNGTPRPLLQWFLTESAWGNLSSSNWSDIWGQIRTWADNLPGNCTVSPYNAANASPLFLFRDNPGFTHPASAGSFNWVQPAGGLTQQSNANLTFLDSFAQAAVAHPSLMSWGVGYKGFNDIQAWWSEARVIDQSCGMTWVNSMSRQDLPYMTVATWNDYDEGTEIETGIDNCIDASMISPSVNGGTLTFAIVIKSLGPVTSIDATKTVHHFTIWDATDSSGATMRGSQDVTWTTNTCSAPVTGVSGAFNTKTYTCSVDLTTMGYASGTHFLFVQIQGASSFKNQLSTTASPYVLGTTLPTGAVDEYYNQLEKNAAPGYQHVYDVGQSGLVHIYGWAADVEEGVHLQRVEVYAVGANGYNFLGNATLNQQRPDVATGTGHPEWLNSGWTLDWRANLPVGTYTIRAAAFDTTSPDPHYTWLPVNQSTALTITANTAPHGGVDAAYDQATQSMTMPRGATLYVAGWVADRQDGVDISRLAIYLNGSYKGDALLRRGPRPDVKAAFNRDDYLNSLFEFFWQIPANLAPGSYTVTAIGIDSQNLSANIAVNVGNITIQ